MVQVQAVFMVAMAAAVVEGAAWLAVCMAARQEAVVEEQRQ